MKALRLIEYNKNYKLCDIPIPSIWSGELLVRISASSYYHTDYQVYQGAYQSKYPMTPSHEPAGTIVAVGLKEVQDNELECCMRNKCRWCKASTGKLDARFCEDKNMAGIMTDRGFAEYLIADASNTVLLPQGLEFEQAAPLMCAGATIWGAIAQCNLKPGDSVAILSVGGLGILGDIDL